MRPGAVAAVLVVLALPGVEGHAVGERSLDGVMVQMEYVSTWGPLDEAQPFGHMPELTMYEDGTVIYLEETKPLETGWNVRTAILGREARADLVDELLQRGFERLESHTRHSGLSAEGTDTTVYDSAFSVITVRLPNGKLRTIRNYAGFANDRQALKSIREFLSQWSSPDAEPYTPARATLVIKWLDPRSAASYGHLPEVASTLLEALLEQPEEGICEWAVPISGSEYRSLISQPGLGPQWTYFSTLHEGKRLFLSIVPWLPNEDHTVTVRRYRQRCLWRPGPYAGSVRWINDARY